MSLGSDVGARATLCSLAMSACPPSHKDKQTGCGNYLHPYGSWVAGMQGIHVTRRLDGVRDLVTAVLHSDRKSGLLV